MKQYSPVTSLMRHSASTNNKIQISTNNKTTKKAARNNVSAPPLLASNTGIKANRYTGNVKAKCKRASITAQKSMFCNAKDRLLAAKMPLAVWGYGIVGFGARPCGFAIRTYKIVDL